MNIGDELYLDIKRLGINGEGIAYYKKLAIFIKGAIPGERIKAKITKVMPNMAHAEVKEVINKSEHRQEAVCPYYNKCGACQVMHINNNYTGSLKKELVIEAIKRYTKLNPNSFEIRDTISMDNPYNYRNKSTVLLKKVNGKISQVMIEENSNKTISFDKCLVVDEKINEINTKIVDLCNKLNIKAYGDDRYSLRYLLTRVSKATRESLVCLIVYKIDDEINKLAKKIIANNICDSLYININTNSKSINLLGDETKYIYGLEYITEYIDKYQFAIYPQTFFQLNSYQVKNLYDKVKKVAKLSHKEVVLDAYCGVGTIGIYLANLAKEVYGIEYNKDSIELAKINAKKNKINNINFYQGNVVKLLPDLLNKNINFDILLFDPPRTGLGKDNVDTILKLNIKKIIYVSCNPSTLAKDLALLTNKYKVNSIDIVDMFPNTSHVESVVLLTLK